MRSKIIISKMTFTATNLSDIALFDKNIEHIIMNSKIEVAKFEPEPTSENIINEIKTNNLKVSPPLI